MSSGGCIESVSVERGRGIQTAGGELGPVGGGGDRGNDTTTYVESNFIKMKVDFRKKQKFN